MSSEKSIYLFPNGQGGVFPAMKSAETFNHMYDKMTSASNKIEYIHFISTDNLLNVPGDLHLVGYAASSGAAITIKTHRNDAYSSYTASHTECPFLLEDKDGKLRVVKNFDITKPEFVPSLCHSVNCVVRADFFQNKEFKEKFNYMQK